MTDSYIISDCDGAALDIYKVTPEALDIQGYSWSVRYTKLPLKAYAFITYREH